MRRGRTARGRGVMERERKSRGWTGSAGLVQCGCYVLVEARLCVDQGGGERLPWEARIAVRACTRSAAAGREEGGRETETGRPPLAESPYQFIHPYKNTRHHGTSS